MAKTTKKKGKKEAPTKHKKQKHAKKEHKPHKKTHKKPHKKEHKEHKEAPKEHVQSTAPIQKKELFSIDTKMLLVALVGIILLVFVTWKLGAFTLGGKDAVVKVNGAPITEEDIQAEFAKLPPFYLTSANQDEVRAAVIDQLIAKLLILEESETLGISATDQEVEETLQNLTDQSGLNEMEFKYKLQEQNITEEELARLVEEQIVVNKVVEQEVLEKIEVTEEDILSYYEESQDLLLEVRASHILICYEGATKCTKNRTKEEALNEANDLIARLKAGESIDTLAELYSDDPSAAVNAGDLGWFPRGRMVPEFDEAVFSMNPGEVSETAVETVFGYHVILVTDKKQELSDFKDKIVETLTFERQKTALQDYVDMLRETAEITFLIQDEETKEEEAATE